LKNEAAKTLLAIRANIFFWPMSAASGEKMSRECDLTVVGAGPAGLAAGLYGARLGIHTVLIGEVAGGLAAEAWLVENYPGVEPMRGLDLVGRMQRQAESAGLEMMVPETVERLDLGGCRKGTMTASEELWSHAIVIATGCCHRSLGVPGEQEFRGRGVSYCAVCDGVFFKGGRVMVVGGGNTAAMEALYLKEIAGKVFMAHRRSDLRADAALKQRVLDGGIEMLWNKQVVEIQGGNQVSRVVLRDVQGDEDVSLEVDGVFIAVGESPQSGLAKDAGVLVDQEGFITVNRQQETNLPGVYAAGDVTGGVHQIGVAVGQGITAAVNAYLYVTGGWYGKGKSRQAKGGGS